MAYLPVEKVEKLIGQKFGLLTVLGIDDIKHEDGRRKYYLRCKCDCGNETVVYRDQLLNKKSGIRSCGCLKSTSNILTDKPKKTNKLGHKNIVKAGNSYKVQITYKGKPVMAEYFKTLEDAIKARDDFRANELPKLMNDNTNKMPKKIDGSWFFEDGTRINEWTVLSNERKVKGNNYYVKCQCSCGTISWVRVDKLVSGASKMCRVNRLYHSTLEEDSKELIGKRFGKLKVIGIDRAEIDEKKNSYKIYLKCQCDCGNKDYVVFKNDLLRKRGIRSCGCEQLQNKQDEVITKLGGDFDTRLPLVEKEKPNKNNKLGQRNIYEKQGYYVVTFTFRKKVIYSEYFKDLDDAIEARDDFRDNKLQKMIEEIKSKL